MSFLNFFRSLDRAARIGFAAGAAAILVFAAIAVWWLATPREQLLFGGLKQADAAEIVQALDEWKVPHTIVDDGAGISVPADVLYETRMRLVSAGIPRGGAVGFELFDDSDFGVTEFAQRVNYQRALQGEIERTIAALPGVENVRVHLSIRRPGLFVGDREQSKASVALGLHAGETLTARQVRGIRSLVAGAVEGLSMEQVSIVDAGGNLLAGGGATLQSYEARDDVAGEVEDRLRTRIFELLGQVLDSDDYRVSVDVQMNFDSVRRIDERPMHDDAVVVRKRVNAPDPAAFEGQAAQDEDVEYRHGTVREEVAAAPGRIERISVAVILPVGVGDNELQRIESLVSAAAGLDERRGDRLEISRLGRGATADAGAAGARASAEGAASTPARVGFEASAWPAWTRMAMLLALGLLLGLILGYGLQRRPPRLAPAEREAVLGKMRAWLAEGTPPQ